MSVNVVSVTGGLSLSGGHVDVLAAVFAFGEEHCAVNESVNGVVFAQTYVLTGMVHCATLALDDVAGFAFLTTENLHAKSFAF